MKKEEIRNFRELEKVNMIVVCEGKGTEESPSRLVRYIYSENMDYIGEIDPLNTHN